MGPVGNALLEELEICIVEAEVLVDELVEVLCEELLEELLDEVEELLRELDALLELLVELLCRLVGMLLELGDMLEVLEELPEGLKVASLLVELEV